MIIISSFAYGAPQLW